MERTTFVWRYSRYLVRRITTCALVEFFVGCLILWAGFLLANFSALSVMQLAFLLAGFALLAGATIIVIIFTKRRPGEKDEMDPLHMLVPKAPDILVEAHTKFCIFLSMSTLCMVAANIVQVRWLFEILKIVAVVNFALAIIQHVRKGIIFRRLKS